MAQTVGRLDIDLLGAWRRAAQTVALPLASVLQSYVERYFHAGMRPGLRRVGGRIVGAGKPNRTSKLYRNTGRLARSFAPRARENVLRIRRDAIEYGTRVPYAVYHEYGTSIHRPRPFISPALRDLARERIIEDVLSELLRNVSR